MIPKIIHYCWFGNKELPELVKKCITTWHKHLPNYEFKLWNEETFDIYSSEWCIGAYKEKKYAFIADYVRLIKLYEYGGIYLDTDIKLEKSLTPFIEKDEAFMGFEDGKILSMGLLGFPPQHHVIKEFLYYYSQPFSLNLIDNNISNALITTNYLVEKYNLQSDNSEQIIENIHIYPRTYFNPMDFFGNWDRSKNTVAVHLYMGSWLPENAQKKLNRRKTWWWRVGKWFWVNLGLQKLKTILYKR